MAIEESRDTARFFWLALVFLTTLWTGLILAAPLSAAFGLETGATNLYALFSYICHQMPDRSFHVMEHKFGVCSRCFGVYFGLLAGALVYPIFRSIYEINPLPRIWLVLAMIPIGVDWSLTFFGFWENTFTSRFVTGLILGAACSVFIVPALAELAQMLHLPKNDDSVEESSKSDKSMQ